MPALGRCTNRAIPTPASWGTPSRNLLQIGQHLRRPSGKNLQLHRRLRAQPPELAHKPRHIHIAMAQHHPLSQRSRASSKTTEGAWSPHTAPDVSARRTDLPRQIVPRVQACGQKSLPDSSIIAFTSPPANRPSDSPGQSQPHIHGLGAHRPEQLDRILHVRLDGTVLAGLRSTPLAAHDFDPTALVTFNPSSSCWRAGGPFLLNALADSQMQPMPLSMLILSSRARSFHLCRLPGSRGP